MERDSLFTDHKSLKYLFTQKAEHETAQMVGVLEGLRLFLRVSPMKIERSSRCTE
ncbi:hypothetical protein Scep_011775 [Stephania cephalantha]|uniref:Uncharacterized protein n=1 Tax=Stephania cephalantha TaxID=152367 RepID=A0AAP0P5X1_9MAGN